MIVTYQEILAILKADTNYERLLMFDRIFRVDDNYFVASKRWYEREFFPWYELQLRHYHVRDYEGSWDCDKFANFFQVFAQICHAFTKPKATEGIAVAEIHYLPGKSDSMHAINAVIVDDKKLKFIEPQKPAFIELSTSEQRSITFMKW